MTDRVAGSHMSPEPSSQQRRGQVAYQADRGSVGPVPGALPTTSGAYRPLHFEEQRRPSDEFVRDGDWARMRAEGRRQAALAREARRRRKLRAIAAGGAAVAVIALAAILIFANPFSGGGHAEDAASPASATTSEQMPLASSQDDSGANAAAPAPSAEPAQASQDLTLQDVELADAPSQDTPEPPAYLGVEDPYVPGGYFTTGDPELDWMVKDFCDDNSVGDDRVENAQITCTHLSWSEFVEHQDNQTPEGPDWSIEYAKQLFSQWGGNCYNFSAGVQWVLRYFGYSDAEAQPCVILRQSGAWGDHGLCFVTDVDGAPKFIDSALGANGWMLECGLYTYQIRDFGQVIDPDSIAGRFSSGTM